MQARRDQEMVRKDARIHCERLGHDLTIWEPMPSLKVRKEHYAHKARCVNCSRLVIVNARSANFDPDSGLHGSAPLHSCTNDRPTNQRPLSANPIYKYNKSISKQEPPSA